MVSIRSSGSGPSSVVNRFPSRHLSVLAFNEQLRTLFGG
jgi:hypothetical protein